MSRPSSSQTSQIVTLNTDRSQEINESFEILISYQIKQLGKIKL